MVSLALPLSMLLLSTALVVGVGLDRPLLRETPELPVQPAAVFSPQPTCASPRPSRVSRGDLPQVPLLLHLQIAAQAAEHVQVPASSQAEARTFAQAQGSAGPQTDARGDAKHQATIAPPAAERAEGEDSQAGTPGEVRRLLAQWQNASGKLLTPTREAQQRLLHQHRGALNGHQISLLVQFSGPVDCARLCERYCWSVARRDAQTVELAAEPFDEVERLFCRRCTVTLNAESGLPASVRFEGRGGDAAAVAVQTVQNMDADQIELSRLEAPRPLIVTAKLAGESFGPVIAIDSGLQDGRDVPELADLPEDVRRTLLRWEAASARRGPLHLRVKQTLIEKATGRQRHAEGDLHFDDRHDYRLKLTDDRGATLVVTADGATRFVPDAAAEDATAEILKQPPPAIVPVSAEAAIERNPPSEMALLHASLPFTLNLDAATLASQFAWDIVRQDAGRESRGEAGARPIVLRGVPKSDAVRRRFQRVEVLLDSATFRTVRTRVILANGDERIQVIAEGTAAVK